MHSSVEASRRQEELTGDHTYQEKRSATTDLSCCNNFSDDCKTFSESCTESSQSSSASATPVHSGHKLQNHKQVANTGVEAAETHSSEKSSVPKWFKFKRKSKILLFRFLNQLHTHLMMGVKFVLSALLVLATIQFSFPQSPHRVIPQQFYSAHSLVKDYYTGDLQQLAERLRYTDLAFVMYYAPWDRESQNARKHFETAAQHLQEQVFFAAINCWQPDGSCRHNHKVISYPVMVLHINTGAAKDGGGGVLRENRALTYGGPLLTDHLVRFVKAALLPYRHVGDRRQLAAMQLQHTAVVLSYIPVTPFEDHLSMLSNSSLPSEQLSLFYRAALHWLEYDKHEQVLWGVVTDSGLATQLGLSNSSTEAVASGFRQPLPPIRFIITDVNYVFNGTLTSWNEPRPLLEWVSIRAAGAPSWLHVSGAKSGAVSAVLKRGPTLVTFAPDNPGRHTSPYFDVVRGLWIQYSTCPPEGSSPHDTRAGRIATFLLDSFARHRAELTLLRAECDRERASMSATARRLLSMELPVTLIMDVDKEGLSCPSTPPDPDSNCHDEHFTCHRFMPFFIKPGMGGVSELVWSAVGGACQSLFGYSLATQTPHPCSAHSFQASPAPPPVNATASSRDTFGGKRKIVTYEQGSGSVLDERVLTARAWWVEERCRSEYSLENDWREGESWQLGEYDVAGLGCHSNHTIQFTALDSLRHWRLARRWGLDLQKGGSGAVLIDLQQESHYLLEGAATAASLTELLHRFISGTLHRSELSNLAPSLYQTDYVTIPDSSEVSIVGNTLRSSLLKYANKQRRDDADAPKEVDGKMLKKQKLEDPALDKSNCVDGDDGNVTCDNIVTGNVNDDGETHNTTGDCDGDADDENDLANVRLLTIEELTANTYHNVTHAKGQAVLVLHYSRSCVFCTAASHIMLAVAAYCASLRTQLQRLPPSFSRPPPLVFARVDVSANTLPWQLNFPRLPHIIYYPPYSKSSSRVFDSSTSLTPASLMLFLMDSLTPLHRLSVALSTCSAPCVSKLSSRLPAVTATTFRLLAAATVRLRRLATTIVEDINSAASSYAPTDTTSGGIVSSSVKARARVLQLARAEAGRRVAALRRRWRYLLTLRQALKVVGTHTEGKKQGSDVDSGGKEAEGSSSGRCDGGRLVAGEHVADVVSVEGEKGDCTDFLLNTNDADAISPSSSTISPVDGADSPTSDTDSPTSDADCLASGAYSLISGADSPASGADIPTSGADSPESGAESPASGANSLAYGVDSSITVASDSPNVNVVSPMADPASPSTGAPSPATVGSTSSPAFSSSVAGEPLVLHAWTELLLLAHPPL